MLVVPLTGRAARIIRHALTMSDGTYVFVRPDGRPYSPDSVGTAFRRAARSLELVDVTLHTLRHTFISRLVQPGRRLDEAAALVGHRDIRMTQRYAHLAPHHLCEAIYALEHRHSNGKAASIDVTPTNTPCEVTCDEKETTK